MAQPSVRREELLGKIVDTLLVNGIGELSLRPLAKTVGSSARLLIYHFGTKEQLLTDALTEVRQRIDTDVRELAAREQPASLQAFLLIFWKWAILPSSQRYFRLLYEIGGIGMQNQKMFSASFWSSGISKWIDIFETSFTVLAPAYPGDHGASTLILAALNGLLRDFFATGDSERTTAALLLLIEKMSATPNIAATKKTPRKKSQTPKKRVRS